MKNKFMRILCILLIFSIALMSPAFAHSGRTDSSGGHKDNKNKSGLGSYHYHCGGHGPHLHNGGICPYDPKDKISVNNMPSKMYVGDSIELDWDVTAYSGSYSVDWQSSNKSVLSISSSGVLKAISPGNAKITASLRNGEKTYNVSVSNRLVDKIELSVSTNDTYVGSVFSVNAQVLPNSATDKRLEWVSENEDVAVVMGDGLVIVIGEGTAKITANALDGSGKKNSVTFSSTVNKKANIDAAYILNQLPKGYTFLVKPGSAASIFTNTYKLPYEYAKPRDLPLQIGSKGQTVKDIQKELISAGYLNDKADGVFGRNTNAGIANFCDANGINYTGTVDFDLYVAIMESNIITSNSASEAHAVPIISEVLRESQNMMPQIDIQPIDVMAAMGEPARVTVIVSGENLTYAWYASDREDNGKYYKSETITGNTYGVEMNDTRNGRSIYCIITDAHGNSVTSDTVTLTRLNESKIVKQPENVSVRYGETAKTSVSVIGEDLSYVWYASDTEDNGIYYKSDLLTGDTYSAEMNDARNGRKIYCAITDSQGRTVTTDIVVLKMEP